MLLGCSDDSTGDATNNPPVKTGWPDPCSLASATDFAAITGVQATHTKKEWDGGDSVCTWYDSAGYGELVIRELGDDVFELKPLMQLAPIAGLGEDAFLSDYSTVYVKTAKAQIFVQSLLPAIDGNLSAPIQAADTSAKVHKDVRTSEASYRIAKIAAGKL